MDYGNKPTVSRKNMEKALLDKSGSVRETKVPEKNPREAVGRDAREGR